MEQEMIFLFRHFRPLKSTLCCLAKFHTAKNICTAPYLIDLCTEMSWLMLNSWITGDTELAEKSLLRPVPVGLGSFHSSGYFCCLKLCCTALTHKQSLGAAYISNTRIFFFQILCFYCLFVCIYSWWMWSAQLEFVPKSEKSQPLQRNKEDKNPYTQTLPKLHPTLWFPTRISSYNRLHFFWKHSCTLLKI